MEVACAQVAPHRSASPPAREGAPKGSLLLVGGGLQNGLIALARLSRQPDAQVTIIEREPAFGGNHTWSFHEGDVRQSSAAWWRALVSHTWSDYEVRFSGYRRIVPRRYFAITSERFNRVLKQALERSPRARALRGEVCAVRPGEVTTRAGERRRGALVVDARGPRVTDSPERQLYQKFLGFEVEVGVSQTPERPTLMDATVPQLDAVAGEEGLRFVYTLPLSPGRVLIEDTYYSTSPLVDRRLCGARIAEYARQRGMTIHRVLREEHGALPLPLEVGSQPMRPGVLVGGYRGGWFHPTTGYSVPVALRLADTIAASLGESEAERTRRLAALQAEHLSRCAYYTLLNRLLLNAFEPKHRIEVLARFYRRPLPLIERFYALQTSRLDHLRILLGAPPRGFSLRRFADTRRHS